jgi:hypothetical protein
MAAWRPWWTSGAPPNGWRTGCGRR